MRTAVALLLALRSQDPQLLEPESEASFRKHWGPPELLEALRTAKSVDAVTGRFARDEQEFARERADILLY